MQEKIPPLGGYQSVADILGVTRGAIYDRWKRMRSPRSRSDFPKPYTVLPSGQPLWNLEEIREYAKKNSPSS
jgi:predicted DNA-binding transcriptional regulator AlpA